MATEAPRCPECGAALGTPVNIECGVEPGRFHGPDDSNLYCPSCGTGWKGGDIAVADAWRSFVEFEKTQVEP
jgi:hypothetical protein